MPVQTRLQLKNRFFYLIQEMIDNPNRDNDLIARYVVEFEDKKTPLRTLIRWLEKELDL